MFELEKIMNQAIADPRIETELQQPVQGHGSTLTRILLSNEFGLAILLSLTFLIFANTLPGFSSTFSLFTIGRQIGINTMIGLAMMAVIVTGGLDLSVGAIGACTAMFFGYLAQAAGVPLVLAIPLAIGFGAGLGFINGATVVKTGVHSFIITLASMSIFFGLMIFLTKAQSFNQLPPEVQSFGKSKIAGVVSPLLVISVVICAIMSIFYRFTTLGRSMLAAGANPKAAELSGIRTGRVITACHVLTGGLAALAGLMLTARTGAAIPSMAGQLGQDWLLPAFLAPVLGGTLLAGGRVSVVGTLLGAAFVNVMTSGLFLMRVGEFWILACLGVMLLLAVLTDKARQTILRNRGMV
jgi:ribose transport system permease protein